MKHPSFVCSLLAFHLPTTARGQVLRIRGGHHATGQRERPFEGATRGHARVRGQQRTDQESVSSSSSPFSVTSSFVQDQEDAMAPDRDVAQRGLVTNRQRMGGVSCKTRKGMRRKEAMVMKKVICTPATTKVPTKRLAPTKKPSRRGGVPAPSASPSVTSLPSKVPSHHPSHSQQPSSLPSHQPSQVPSHTPSDEPSSHPSESVAPSSTPSQMPSASPSGYVCTNTTLFPTNGHRYWVGPRYRSYLQAETDAGQLPHCCGGKSAHLATVTSDAEVSFVAEMLWNVGAPGGWIGLSDRQLEGTFRWVTGEKLKKTYWQDGNPSGAGGLDCVGMWHLGSSQGYWTTLNCELSRSDIYMIVEYDCT